MIPHFQIVLAAWLVVFVVGSWGATDVTVRFLRRRGLWPDR